MRPYIYIYSARYRCIERMGTARRRVVTIGRHVAPCELWLEPSRPVPVLDRCDVLVCGGGCAGVAAAVAAKRAGAEHVLVVEQAGFFGGTITGVGMESVTWFNYDGTLPLSGLVHDFEAAARAKGPVSWRRVM